MKKSISFQLLILLMLFSAKSFSQDIKNQFNAGIDVGLGLNTIQPYTKHYGFFEDIDYGKSSELFAGIFVNRFLSKDKQLEFGFYFLPKGTAYCRFFGVPILFSNDCNGKSLNYLQIPLTLYSYPHVNGSFSYSFGLSYCYLFDETSDNAFDLYNDYSIEMSLGLKLELKELRWSEKNYLRVQFEYSLIPISINKNIDLYNLHVKNDMLKNQRNYALKISWQKYF